MNGDDACDPTPTIDLVRAAQKGDASALESLFRRYLPRVRQIVALRLKRPVGDLERVEDLVQEAILKALTSIDRFEERSEGTFRNLIAHCVQSAIVDHLRKEGAKKRGGGRVRKFTELAGESLTSSIFVGETETPSEIAQRAEIDEGLEKALLALDDHYREAVVLVKLCGLSYAEAAEAMGFRNPGNVRQIVFRAVRKLRALLGADAGGE